MRERYGRIAGRQLQAIRERHFRHYPLCVICERKGRVSLAMELDHIVPLHKGGQDIPSNRQGLCSECHEEKTRQDRAFKPRPQIGQDGFPCS
jgi:5-methylcytosine-specific restriction protein A